MLRPVNFDIYTRRQPVWNCHPLMQQASVRLWMVPALDCPCRPRRYVAGFEHRGRLRLLIPAGTSGNSHQQKRVSPIHLREPEHDGDKDALLNVLARIVARIAREGRGDV